MTLVLQYLSYMHMLRMRVSGQPSNMFESPYLGLLPLLFPLHQKFSSCGHTVKYKPTSLQFPHPTTYLLGLSQWCHYTPALITVRSDAALGTVPMPQSWIDLFKLASSKPSNPVLSILLHRNHYEGFCPWKTLVLPHVTPTNTWCGMPILLGNFE